MTKQKTTRSKPVLVRFKPEERRKIEALARARGLATSSWLRMIALDAVTSAANKGAKV